MGHPVASFPANVARVVHLDKMASRSLSLSFLLPSTPLVDRPRATTRVASDDGLHISGGKGGGGGGGGGGGERSEFYCHSPPSFSLSPSPNGTIWDTHGGEGRNSNINGKVAEIAHSHGIYTEYTGHNQGRNSKFVIVASSKALQPLTADNFSSNMS